MNNNKIIKCLISKQQGKLNEVWVEYDDSADLKKLFKYDRNTLSLSPHEFIGKTKEEALSLYQSQTL